MRCLASALDRGQEDVGDSVLVREDFFQTRNTSQAHFSFLTLLPCDMLNATFLLKHNVQEHTETWLIWAGMSVSRSSKRV